MREVLLDAKFHDGDKWVVIESTHNRVTAEGRGVLFEQVNLYYRNDLDAPWIEIIAWDCAEWREAGMEAFEAILGVIAMIVAGEQIESV